MNTTTTEPNAQTAKPQSDSAKETELDLKLEKHKVGLGVLAGTYVSIKLWEFRDEIEDRLKEGPKKFGAYVKTKTGIDMERSRESFAAMGAELGEDIRYIASSASCITTSFVGYLLAIATSEHGLIFLRRVFSNNLLGTPNGDVGLAIAKTLSDFAQLVNEDVRLVSKVISKELEREKRQAEAEAQYKEIMSGAFDVLKNAMCGANGFKPQPTPNGLVIYNYCVKYPEEPVQMFWHNWETDEVRFIDGTSHSLFSTVRSRMLSLPEFNDWLGAFFDARASECPEGWKAIACGPESKYFNQLLEPSTEPQQVQSQATAVGELNPAESPVGRAEPPQSANPNYCIVGPTLNDKGCYLISDVADRSAFATLYDSFVTSKQVVQVHWRERANHSNTSFVAQGANFKDADDLHTWLNDSLSRNQPEEQSDERNEDWLPVLFTENSEFFLRVPATEAEA